MQVVTAVSIELFSGEIFQQFSKKRLWLKQSKCSSVKKYFLELHKYKASFQSIRKNYILMSSL